MNEIYDLKEKLIDELKKYSRKDITTNTLDAVDKIAHAVKNLCKVLEDAEGGENSMEYRGNSYARRRRDSMGRYSREMRDGRSMRGYSYHGDMIEDLKEMMDEAPEEIKSDLRRLITKAESM